MSSSLWAIQAARNSRNSDTVPGSSRYISSEMKNSLEVSKEGIDVVNQQVLQCARGLNSIIEKINIGVAFDSLKHEIQNLHMEAESVAGDDPSSRSHSALLRSDYLSSDASEAPLKSELNILLSEKVRNGAPSASSRHESSDHLFGNSATESRHDQQIKISLLEKEHDQLSKNKTATLENSEASSGENRNPSRSSIIAHGADHGTNGTFGEPVQSVQSVHEPAQAAHIETPTKTSELESSDHLEPKVPIAETKRPSSSQLKEGAAEPFIPEQPSPTAHESPQSAAFSPVMIYPTHLDPVTSPNVDLSFIPIAKSVNSNKNGSSYEYNPDPVDTSNKEKLQPETRDEGEEIDAEANDDSFHAISSAIRKSFAGKLSMHPHTRMSVSDPAAQTEHLYHSSDNVSKTRVKLEPSLSAADDTPPKKSKSFYQPSKRSSLFVSLPPREPINFRKSSRHSVKVKQEDLKPISVKKEMTDINLQSARPQETQSMHQKVPGLELQDSENENSKNMSNRIGNYLSRSSVPKSNLPNLFSEKSYFNKTKSTQTATEIPPNAGKVEKKSKTKSSRGVRTTTESGSPMSQESLFRSPTQTAVDSKSSVRVGSPVRARSSLRSRSPVKSKTQSGGTFPSRAPHSSSAPSSRSPTKYGNSNDRSSTKFSQANFSVTETEKSASKNLIQRLTNPTSSSAAKAVKASIPSDMGLKNRFLTTTLNPEKPPLFTSAPRAVSPQRDIRAESSTRYKKHLAQSGLSSANGDSKPASKRSGIVSLKNDLKHMNNPDVEQHTKSPVKKAKTSAPGTSNEKSKKTIPNIMDMNVAPRKRQVGNAVPLPDAARGIFKREKPRSEVGKPLKESHTPLRPTTRHASSYGKSSVSPGYGPSTLPEIPSDDDAFRNTKYLKSWAETPALLRQMRERSNMDPVNVFGQVPRLRMSEVFSNVSPSNECREHEDS